MYLGNNLRRTAKHADVIYKLKIPDVGFIFVTPCSRVRGYQRFGGTQSVCNYGIKTQIRIIRKFKYVSCNKIAIMKYVNYNKIKITKKMVQGLQQLHNFLV